VQRAPSCWQQSEPDQYAGAVHDEDSEPDVAEEDIPSSLWLPEFVGRKAAVAAPNRQLRGVQQLLKAGHHTSSSRGSMQVQGRPSSAAAALGVGSVRPGSSGRVSLFESSGVGSGGTHSRPVGGLLQARTRPSSAAPKMQ
jgi:hypothetical protein